MWSPSTATAAARPRAVSRSSWSLTPQPARALAASVTWAVALAALVVAVCLAARRWTGSAGTPSTSLLLGQGFVVCVLLALLHRWCETAALPTTRRFAAWEQLALTGVAFVLTAAISLPAAPPLGLVVTWSLLVAHETHWWSRRRLGVWPLDRAGAATVSGTTKDAADRSAHSAASVSSATESAPADTMATTIPPPVRPGADRLAPPHADRDDETSDEIGEDEESILPAGVWQQWTRGAGEGGSEWVEVVCRVTWAMEQRQVNVHLAFCPPLREAPRVSVECLGGEPVEVTIGEARAYGVRLEVRRPRGGPAGAGEAGAGEAGEAWILVRADA